MSKTVPTSLLLLIAAALLAPALPAMPGGDEETKVVPLEKILQNPTAFRDQKIAFVAQFHRLGNIENPFFTKFQSDWYLNFSVWPDSAQLWLRDAYVKDYPYIFVKRLTEGADMVLHAPMYSRWVITAEVSEIFRGKAWIDVKGMKQLETQLDEPSLVHLVRGFTYRDQNNHLAAAAEFRASDKEGLPFGIRGMAMREEAQALHRAGKTPLAVSRLEYALQELPEDPLTLHELQVMRGHLGLDADGDPLPNRPAVARTEAASEPAPVSTAGHTQVGEPAVVEPPVTAANSDATLPEPEPSAPSNGAPTEATPVEPAPSVAAPKSERQPVGAEYVILPPTRPEPKSEPRSEPAVTPMPEPAPERRESSEVVHEELPPAAEPVTVVQPPESEPVTVVPPASESPAPAHQPVTVVQPPVTEPAPTTLEAQPSEPVVTMPAETTSPEPAVEAKAEPVKVAPAKRAGPVIPKVSLEIVPPSKSESGND